MRLFVALVPPASVVEQVTAATAALPAPAGVRWVAPDQVHVTLAFLGEVAPARRPELDRRLERAAARHPPVALQAVGAGRFGDRVLFLRLYGDGERLGRLAASVGAAARRAGVVLEDRPFRAHLTLARARPPVDLRPLVTALEGFRGEAWTATAVQLVHSRLGAGPGGRPAYETLVTWPLAGRLPPGAAAD